LTIACSELKNGLQGRDRSPTMASKPRPGEVKPAPREESPGGSAVGHGATASDQAFAILKS
jgi:hypothetical protein